ncbi:hypothetical protein EKK58_08360 [Candidatus Dependentiae bacterium]|nr:MAG: hypothetical protein EKK58_08360 [Candidatus Dependentiae bacterium]
MLYRPNYKECEIDFEFNRLTKSPVNLVACVTKDCQTGEIKKWWLLHDQKAKSNLVKYLKQFELFTAYAAAAEARCFLALGLNPLDFKWFDLFVEYRMLTNHNSKYSYGMQLVDGKPKMTRKPPPKWERTEGQMKDGFRATHSLAEATYKITKEIRDTEHKDKMRDLIIADLPLYTEENIKDILDYAAEDVIHLTKLKEGIVKAIFDSIGSMNDHLLPSYWEEAYYRGRYSAHTAIMEDRGYRIDYERLKNFSDRVPAIVHACQKEINELFPQIKPFRWNKKDQRFSVDQKAIEGFIIEWCAANDESVGAPAGTTKSRWMRTDGGGLSQSLEAFEQFFPFKHEYPKDNFGAQIVRYLKLRQSLAGFIPSANSKRKNFWDYVDGDIVRPYLNPFGAQSSRTQPSATGFLFLKPAWMRTFCIPPNGKAYGGIDYASQEFFISALKSDDYNMISAYESGDVYLAFAIQARMVPEDATKDSHKYERNLCKSTCLLEGTLIRVKGKGYVPVEKVTAQDMVWDGADWRSCSGAKYMGEKEVIELGGEYMTPDHLVLGEDNEWRQASIYKESQVCKWKVCQENDRGLQGQNFSWEEIWNMGSYLLRSKVRKAYSAMLCAMYSLWD